MPTVAWRADVPLPRLTTRAIRSVPVLVPMTYALGTSADIVRQAPLLLVDLETQEGVTGRAYQFCYRLAAAPAIARFLVDILEGIGGRPVDPPALWSLLARRYTLIGVQGIVRMAMSLVDIACWDALARAEGLSLARFLGAAPRPIPAYNSNGLGLMPPDALAEEAGKLLEGGFRAIKLRLGYSRVSEDLGAVRAVRKRIPAEVAVMTDYNQALSADEAICRSRLLDDEGVSWIEEPIRHDDFQGCARVASAATTPIQIGENFSQVYDMQKALDARACDYVMPDVERIGGVTGWKRAAQIAASRGIPMSSHLFAEVSAHLLANTPTAHWLEYMDWAGAVVEEPLVIRDGMARVSGKPGAGLTWERSAVERYRIA